jgi:hypothetical protein
MVVEVVVVLVVVLVLEIVAVVGTTPPEVLADVEDSVAVVESTAAEVLAVVFVETAAVVAMDVDRTGAGSGTETVIALTGAGSHSSKEDDRTPSKALCS